MREIKLVEEFDPGTPIYNPATPPLPFSMTFDQEEETREVESQEVEIEEGEE